MARGWIIVEEEAETVRMIYRLYLNGLSMFEICQELEASHRLRQDGGSKWHVGSISYILNNPAYCGDILLQKSYTVDFRGRVRKKNEGEVPMYYVEEHHPGIISKHTYDRVQLEIKRRSGHKPADFSVSPFFGSVYAKEMTGTFSENPSIIENFCTENLTGERDNATSEIKKTNEINVTSQDNLKNSVESQSFTNNVTVVAECGKAAAKRIPYHRVTIHSNVEKWKKAVWKPKRATSNIYPTISEDELYRIFHYALLALAESSDETLAAIASASASMSKRVSEIEEMREQLLDSLKKLLNRISAEGDKEKYESLVRDYNQGQGEYEKLGDEQWQLEKQLECGRRLAELMPEIEKYADGQVEGDTQHCVEMDESLGKSEYAVLSDLYLKSYANMCVAADHVTVEFGAGIAEVVKIKKIGKSWCAL